MITTVIFDIGGVLITPAEKITPFILSQLLRLPMETMLAEWSAAENDLRHGRMTVLALATAIGLKYGAPVTSDFESSYARYYDRQTMVSEDSIRIINALTGKVKLIALSNMIDLHVRINRARGLFGPFSRTYLSSETGKVKPEKDAYVQILSESGVSASECLFVDDAKENVMTARELGMATVLYGSSDEFRAICMKEGLL